MFVFIGIARPFALQPNLLNQIAQGCYQTIQTQRIKTGIKAIDQKVGAMLEMNWYMMQMKRIAQGKQPKPTLSAWTVLLHTLWDSGKAGLSTGRA